MLPGLRKGFRWFVVTSRGSSGTGSCQFFRRTSPHIRTQGGWKNIVLSLCWPSLKWLFWNININIVTTAAVTKCCPCYNSPDDSLKRHIMDNNQKLRKNVHFTAACLKESHGYACVYNMNKCTKSKYSEVTSTLRFKICCLFSSQWKVMKNLYFYFTRNKRVGKYNKSISLWGL